MYSGAHVPFSKKKFIWEKLTCKFVARLDLFCKDHNSFVSCAKIRNPTTYEDPGKPWLPRKLEGEPELTCTLAFHEIQKIVKIYEKFGKKLGAYAYKFFTLVNFFRIK